MQTKSLQMLDEATLQAQTGARSPRDLCATAAKYYLPLPASGTFCPHQDRTRDPHRNMQRPFD
eukprot:12826692-Alexandrium_andersonii.AAC.1